LLQHDTHSGNEASVTSASGADGSGCASRVWRVTSSPSTLKRSCGGPASRCRRERHGVVPG
jgi:hypothetical protein